MSMPEGGVFAVSSTPRRSFETSESVGPFGSPADGSTPANANAAARVPAPSAPSSMTIVRPFTAVTATAPSDVFNVSAGGVAPSRAAACGPMAMAGPDSALRFIGRSMASVSCPSRAATSAAAATSSVEGVSGSTIVAATASGTLSPLVSSTRPPSDHMVASDGAAAAAACDDDPAAAQTFAPIAATASAPPAAPRRSQAADILTVTLLRP